MDYKTYFTTPSGKIIKKYISAPDENIVEELIVNNNGDALEVVPMHKSVNKVKISKKYLLQFFAKLRICYRIGMPILQSLNLCKTIIPHPKFKKVIEEISNSISEGKTLSECLWQYPNVFPPVVCRLIQVGENTGGMHKACTKIANMLTVEMQTRRKIRSAMFYPAMVCVALIIAVYVLITRTIPAFTTLFSATGVELPWVTRTLMSITDVVVEHPIGSILTVIGSIATIIMIPKIYNASYRFQKIAIRIPPFAGLMRYSQRLQLVSTLYTVLEAQVPMLQALRMTRNTLSNVYFKDAMAKAIRKVTQGKGISEGLATQEWILTTELVQSMEFANETGATTDVLRSLSEDYQENLEYQINLFKEAINPIITIIIAVVVLFILLSLFLPMFDMTKAISKM